MSDNNTLPTTPQGSTTVTNQPTTDVDYQGISKLGSVPGGPPPGEALLARISALEQRDAENQETIKKLLEVADKGRLYNYEAGHATKKPFTVKLSVHNGKIITGWRTVKDELVKHPTTGKTVGEVQEYELILMDSEGRISKATVNGYPAFSEARYTERIEVEVAGRTEDWQGHVTFKLNLPSGRTVELDSRFVN